MSERHPLPSAFVHRVEQDAFLGTKLVTALDTAVPVSVRLNPQKSAVCLPIERAIPWCEHAYYLSERPLYTLDPLFHAGTYYPQEAGSMFLEYVLRQLVLPENPLVLDLCAAPGGKSTLLSTWMQGEGLLVSNEVIQARSKVLKENMTKWGSGNNLVTNNDPADFQRLRGVFDLIVIDAPCSGEGMFRKDPAARGEWSPEHVDLCAARQKRIVADVWDALQPGGFLIYSTCTFNEAENEANVHWMQQELGAELLPFDTGALRQGRQGIGAYALPSEVDTEGFYIAVVQKKGERKPVKWTLPKKFDLMRVKDPKGALPWANLAGRVVFQWHSFWFAVPETHALAVQCLHHALRCSKLGTELGELFPKGFVPNIGLLLDPVLRKLDGKTLEVTREQALLFLKGETFPLSAPAGIFALTYQQEPIGWIKHLGNRFNNLYPKEWRIRMRIDG